MKLAVIRMEISADAAIDPTPRAAIDLRDRRGPAAISKKLLAIGSAGISQTKSSTLSPHITLGVRIKRVPLVIDLKNQSQADGDFSGRHGQDENEDDLAIRLSP